MFEVSGVCLAESRFRFCFARTTLYMCIKGINNFSRSKKYIILPLFQGRKFDENTKTKNQQPR